MQVLDDQGKLEQARVMYEEKVIPVRLKALGPNHPRMATSYNNLASVSHVTCMLCAYI